MNPKNIAMIVLSVALGATGCATPQPGTGANIRQHYFHCMSASPSKRAELTSYLTKGFPNYPEGSGKETIRQVFNSPDRLCRMHAFATDGEEARQKSKQYLDEAMRRGEIPPIGRGFGFQL